MNNICFRDLSKDLQDALIAVFSDRLSSIEDLQNRHRIDNDIFTADAVWDHLEKQKQSILRAVKESRNE